MDPATSSLSLIERIQKGDREAFTPLFEKYRNRLSALLHCKLSVRLRKSVEVDDLVQETLIRAYRELDSFVYRSPGSFFRWLARIADHVVIDAARFEGRRKRNAEANVPFRSPSNPDGPEPVDSLTPSRIYAQRERLDRLLEVLDALPENYRQAIIMAKIEDLTTNEIAEKLGKSREAAALLLHRALKQIRRIERSGLP
jgi:RNA polymerase sigma-70 factor (ECF subfamily)